ncbi:hypothetical protein LIPSTDRAFT_73628 [Lipomyces starkeyi NRRL Y-11557]|uniref:Uncharacterized protein n=1 Tax=Lipomyces starkeyi NRRL Y-11557 TaxID=675824 RepID=A0A1E3Q006_LIPST|nr:hypothetical protein LIPSTDRAFT_73628 [Lipomyces starkeyi NRRL Y-11557]
MYGRVHVFDGAIAEYLALMPLQLSRYGIHAMPTVDLNPSDSAVLCAPPNTSRPPGRPHKRRHTTNEFVPRKTNI